MNTTKIKQSIIAIFAVFFIVSAQTAEKNKEEITSKTKSDKQIEQYDSKKNVNEKQQLNPLFESIPPGYVELQQPAPGIKLASPKEKLDKKDFNVKRKAGFISTQTRLVETEDDGFVENIIQKHLNSEPLSTFETQVLRNNVNEIPYFGDGVFRPSITERSVAQRNATSLFFSEYSEGNGNNKYLEIYNGTSDVVSLDDVVILGNYNGNPWSETFTFQAGATVAAGDVYIIANSEADEAILALADETHAYGDPWYITSFNGNDVRALAQINGTDTTIIDIIGTLDGGDPGSGWDVAGVTNGTENHVLVRKSTVTVGNSGNWTSSSGTDEDNSEWHVLDHNNWGYLGSHPHDISVDPPSIEVVSPESGVTLFSNELTIEYLVSNFSVGSAGDGVD